MSIITSPLMTPPSAYEADTSPAELERKGTMLTEIDRMGV
jgi:hypothetical protein